MAWAKSSDIEPRIGKIIADNAWSVDKVEKSILSDAITDAKNEIIRIMRERGYTVAQINLWAQQKFNHRSLAIYLAIVDLGYQKDDEQDWIDKYDIRDVLMDVELMDEDGEVIVPAEPTEGIFEMYNLEDINDDLSQEP